MLALRFIAVIQPDLIIIYILGTNAPLASYLQLD
jgi:hypothetical protein